MRSKAFVIVVGIVSLGSAAFGGEPTSSTSSTTPSTSVSSTSTPSTSVSSTSASTTSVSSTSVSTTSSSSTTVPGGCTRTPGFFKNRPVVTQGILDAVGGIDICGVHVDKTSVDSATSALEAMCVSVEGESKIQLARSLMAAALSSAGGGATFVDFDLCNMVCEDPAALKDDITDCINAAGAFNQSGDDEDCAFDTGGAANSTPCRRAKDNDCLIVVGGSCANP